MAISVKTLLEAGVHFGHQTRRWNPKMKPYILCERNGIYVLDLNQTIYALDDAYTFVKNLAATGQSVLFVGTKKQAQDPIRTHAEACGMPYVNYRWMGGMLTNFATIKTRVKRMEELKGIFETEAVNNYNKKERASMKKELEKLELALGGIREMNNLPGAIFVVDTKFEQNAINEARRLHIPVIGLLDTNADPDEVDFGIPANDDAIRSVDLMCGVISSAITAATGADITVEEMEAAAAAPAEEPAAEEAAAE